MTTQPEALRLAEIIDWPSVNYGHQAAAELRRLHAENEALREALQQIIDLPEDFRIHYKVARRALGNGGAQ